MTRREDWEIEIDAAMKRESWQATGPNRPVKFCPAEWTIDIRLGGYITLGKYLIGKTPQDIERDLGLPKDFSSMGPVSTSSPAGRSPAKFEYRLTADHPDGFADEGAFPRKVPPVEDRRRQVYPG